jgi:transmembrane sensor
MQASDYSNYDLGDFAADKRFVEWVLTPTAEAEAFWTKIQADHPEMTGMIEKAKVLVLSMESQEIRMSDLQRQRLWENIDAATSEVSPSKSRPLFTNRIAYSIAASVIICVLVLAGVWLKTTDSSSELITMSNPAGKTSVVNLEDGTKIWLNAESKLFYPKTFKGHDVRMVKLEGEAFFDVAEDKTKTFIVDAKSIEVKVLGTAFNVKAFPDDDRVETTLLRGKIRASSTSTPTEEVTLGPDEQAVFSRTDNDFDVRRIEAKNIAAWKDGVLIFDNTPFDQVKESIERKYGVEIILDDAENLRCHFSGTIRNEPIEKVLELLQTTSNINYEINGNAVRVKGALCEHGSSKP